MGWFDQQIEDRKKAERELLADSYENIARSITGRRISNVIGEGSDVSDAIASLLKYFGIKQKEVPAKIKDLEGRLDYLLSASGIMYREVILEKGWHRDAMGPMIVRLEDGSVITLLPGTHRGPMSMSIPIRDRRSALHSRGKKRSAEKLSVSISPFPRGS